MLRATSRMFMVQMFQMILALKAVVGMFVYVRGTLN